MNTEPSVLERICDTDIWLGSEKSARAAISSKMSFRTVICLRHDLPAWWDLTRSHFADRVQFYHYPVPSIHTSGMEAAIFRIATHLLPSVGMPALVFCLEGKNRTGVLAGVLTFLTTRKLKDALDEYRGRAGDNFRQEELRLTETLCLKLVDDDMK